MISYEGQSSKPHIPCMCYHALYSPNFDGVDKGGGLFMIADGEDIFDDPEEERKHREEFPSYSFV